MPQGLRHCSCLGLDLCGRGGAGAAVRHGPASRTRQPSVVVRNGGGGGRGQIKGISQMRSGASDVGGVGDPQAASNPRPNAR